MKNSIQFAFLFAIVLFFSSCNHYLYTPPEASLLMVSEKEDAKVSAGFGFGSLDEATYSIQAAYSPVERLAFAANYFQIGNHGNPADIEGDNRDERVSSKMGEFAVGTYFKKDIRAIKNEWTEKETELQNLLVWDVYAGYGRFNLKKAYMVGDIGFNAQHYFLQGGVHFQSKFIGLSYSLKGVMLDYIDGYTFGKLDEDNLQKVQDIQDSPFTFLESSFRIRAGGEKYKFFLSRNWMSAPLGDKDFEYSPSSWHLGLVLEIDDIFRSFKRKS